MGAPSLLYTKRPIRWLGVLTVAIAFLLGFMERMEYISMDLRYQLKRSDPHPAILIVAIDPASLKQLSQWPLPRHHYADVILRLKKGGARLIALDLDFSSRSIPSEDDRLVGAVTDAGNVILSAFHDDKILHGDVTIRSANLPFPELKSAAAGLGSILFPVDSDGAMRRAFLFDRVHGETMLGLAGEIGRLYTGSVPPPLLEGITELRLGQETIRPDPNGTFYINYIGKNGGYPVLSFGDVLEGRIPDELFQDKIVLIGATAMELRDIWKTPYGLYSGVEIQANTLQTLLTGKIIRRGSPWITLGMMILFAFLMELSFAGSLKHQSPRGISRFAGFSMVCLTMGLFFIILSVFLFTQRNLIIDTVPVLMAILAHYLLLAMAFNVLADRSIEVKTVSLSALHTAGAVFQRKEPLDNSLDLIYGILKGVLNVNAIVLERYDSKKQVFISRYIQGPIPRWFGRGPTPLCQRSIQKAIDSREPIVVSNLREVSEGAKSTLPVVRSSLFIPLVTHGGVHGVLHFHSYKANAFQDEDIRLLYTISNQMAMNIGNLDLAQETRRLFYSSIDAFSGALELRDNETEGHSLRVASYAVEVGRILALDVGRQETLRQGALLHDIGKIGVPDAILRKPGKLTPQEMEIIRKHPEYGYWMLKNVEFPEDVAALLLQHHEKYNGTGYPAGLKGKQISLFSRIFSVADTYDAIRSNRPYRQAQPHDLAVGEILRSAGSHFDPDVAGAFISISEERLKAIQQEVEGTIQKKGLSYIFEQIRERG